MNVCLFSIKVPILVKIYHTVIEIWTLNKWSQKFTVSRSVISWFLTYADDTRSRNQHGRI